MRRPGGLRSINGTVGFILLEGGLLLHRPLRASLHSRAKAFPRPLFPRLLSHAFPHQTFAHLSPIPSPPASSRVCSCRHRCSCSKTLRPREGSRDPTAMSSEVVIQDPESLEKKKAAIRNAGTSKLQVIADFDGTLTRYWIDGCRGQSSHGLLQQGNPEYDAKRQALYEYYHPLEYSPTIPIEEKTKLMEEW